MAYLVPDTKHLHGWFNGSRLGGCERQHEWQLISEIFSCSLSTQICCVYDDGGVCWRWMKKSLLWLCCVADFGCL